MSSISPAIPAAVGLGEPGRRRSWWLIASMALNLVLIGFILAWVSGMRPPPPMFAWQRHMMSSLSPADAEIVGQTTDRMEQVQRQSEATFREIAEKLHVILTTEPFDQQAMETTLEEMNAAHAAQQNEAGRAFLAEVRALSPDGRAKLLSGIERESRHWHPPWH